MENEYCIIMSTTDSQEEANRLAEMLVTQGLAACVQSIPITSTYTWKGNLNRESEWLLLIKTRAAFYEAIQDALQKNHSYETPEIIQVPIHRGISAYLTWIDAQTRQNE
ncbi:MAG: divalent-cation tolerance protein CutA [Brevefilum sp.]